jgi:MFS family permease
MYLVFRIFPRNRRGQAMGIYGMGVILAPALGPVLGGFLVDQLDWRYVMFAPVPVTLTGVFMAWRFLPLPVSRPAPYRFDFPGLVLLGAAIGLSLDTLNRLQELAGQEARIAIEGAVAVIALVLFVIRERRARHPLVNIELLRNPAFVYANVGAMALGLAGECVWVASLDHSILLYAMVLSGAAMLVGADVLLQSGAGSRR